MNAAQIHLAFNHLPMAFAIVGVPLLAYALWKKSKELKNVGVLLVVLAGVCSVPTFLSGEPAEELVEDKVGISKSVIHEHEEAGEAFFILSAVLSVLALGAWLFEKFKAPLPTPLWTSLVVLGSVGLILFARTAHLGGLIHHEELGQGTVTVGSEAAHESSGDDEGEDRD